MSFIAPNLSVIVGSSTAAKLMGIAGGLTSLSKIPACNLLVLGAQKRVGTGLSSIGLQKHQGIIYQCPLISDLPREWKRKAARVVSAK